MCEKARFKVGDRVKDRSYQVGGVITAPAWQIRRDNGVFIYASEEAITLMPPVVCAPNGTRCAWWKNKNTAWVNGVADVDWKFCPDCRGKLREG